MEANILFPMLIVAVFLGLIPAFIAHNKGHEFVLWWIYGTSLLIFAFFHALFLKPTGKMQAAQASKTLKKCPYCAEMVNKEAILCRYCGKELEIDPAPARENVLRAAGLRRLEKDKNGYAYANRVLQESGATKGWFLYNYEGKSFADFYGLLAHLEYEALAGRYPNKTGNEGA
jgi:hypothetical protein